MNCRPASINLFNICQSLQGLSQIVPSLAGYVSGLQRTILWTRQNSSFCHLHLCTCESLPSHALSCNKASCREASGLIQLEAYFPKLQGCSKHVVLGCRLASLNSVQLNKFLPKLEDFAFSSRNGNSIFQRDMKREMAA